MRRYLKVKLSGSGFAHDPLCGSEQSLPKSSKVMVQVKIKKIGFFYPIGYMNLIPENQQVNGLINVIIIKFFNDYVQI